MAWGFGNTGGGGGGGFNANDAILHVQAPAHSIVTIAKGSYHKSDAGHERASDSSVYDYYFVVHQSQFDSVTPWTVTATLDSSTIQKPIIINAANEYDMVLYYSFYLLNGSSYNWDYSLSNIITNGAITNQSGRVLLNTNVKSTSYVYLRWVGVDLTGYNTISAYFVNGMSDVNIYGVIWISDSPNVNKFGNSTAWSHQYFAKNESANVTLDVSQYSGVWYVAVGTDTNNSTWEGRRTVYLYNTIISV